MHHSYTSWFETSGNRLSSASLCQLIGKAASSGEASDRRYHQSEGHTSEVTRIEIPPPSEATTGEGANSQLFRMDITSGPNDPLAGAFEIAGWRILAVDMLFEEYHDLSKLCSQVTIRDHFKHADGVWAAT